MKRTIFNQSSEPLDQWLRQKRIQATLYIYIYCAYLLMAFVYMSILFCIILLITFGLTVGGMFILLLLALARPTSHAFSYSHVALTFLSSDVTYMLELKYISYYLNLDRRTWRRRTFFELTRGSYLYTYYISVPHEMLSLIHVKY